MARCDVLRQNQFQSSFAKGPVEENILNVEGENMILHKINDYCLIQCPVTLFFSMSPVIPGQGLFISCLLFPLAATLTTPNLQRLNRVLNRETPPLQSPTGNINYIVKRCPSSAVYSVVLHYRTPASSTSHTGHKKSLSGSGDVGMWSLADN